MTSFERAAKAHIASRGAKGTRELYTSDLARWLAHCELDTIDPDAPTLEAATAFRDALAVKFSAQTVRRTLSALSSMYDSAGIINPFNGKRLTRPEADDVALTKEFSEAEAQALIEAAKADVSVAGVRDTAILQILYEVGLRISSVVSMRRERVLERAGKLFVLVKSKKKGFVEVVLPEASIEALTAWLDIAPESDYVFPGRDASTPLTRRTINKRLAIYGKAAKVENPHPHRFRATFVTASLDAGVPLSEVQAAVHHASPNTTLRYDRSVRGSGVTTALAEFRKNKEKK